MLLGHIATAFLLPRLALVSDATCIRYVSYMWILKYLINASQILHDIPKIYNVFLTYGRCIRGGVSDN